MECTHNKYSKVLVMRDLEWYYNLFFLNFGKRRRFFVQTKSFSSPELRFPLWDAIFVRRTTWPERELGLIVVTWPHATWQCTCIPCPALHQNPWRKKSFKVPPPRLPFSKKPKIFIHFLECYTILNESGAHFMCLHQFPFLFSAKKAVTKCPGHEKPI